MEKLGFTEQLVLKIVDSGLIGIILLIIGYWLKKSISRLQTDQAKFLELEKQNIILRNNVAKDKRERILTNINIQLANFYYPISYRLQKDDALWRLSPQLSNRGKSLPMEANDIIENDYIIKNHLEVVNIIESKSHLIEIDSEFQEQIRAYIKHVAIYNTIRKVDSLKKLNPIDLGSDYPKKFQEMIELKIKELQVKHDEIFHKTVLGQKEN